MGAGCRRRGCSVYGSPTSVLSLKDSSRHQCRQSEGSMAIRLSRHGTTRCRISRDGMLNTAAACGSTCPDCRLTAAAVSSAALCTHGHWRAVSMVPLSGSLQVGNV